MQRQVTAHSGLPPQNGPRVYVLGAGKGHVTAPPPRSQPPARRARMQLNNARPCDRSAHLRMYLGGGSARALGMSCIAIARFGTRGRGRVGAKTPPNPPRNPLPSDRRHEAAAPLLRGRLGTEGTRARFAQRRDGKGYKAMALFFFPPKPTEAPRGPTTKKKRLENSPHKGKLGVQRLPSLAGPRADASRQARCSKSLERSPELTAGGSAQLSPHHRPYRRLWGEGAAATWRDVKVGAVSAVPDGSEGTKHCRDITLSAEVGVGVVPGVLVVLEDIQARGLRADRRTDRGMSGGGSSLGAAALHGCSPWRIRS